MLSSFLQIVCYMNMAKIEILLILPFCIANFAEFKPGVLETILKEMRSLRSTNARLLKMNAEYEKRLTKIEENKNQKRIFQPNGSHKVAFQAFLSNNPEGLGVEHTIPFDNVLINEGHAFDSIMHTFICPTKGIYVFQSALLSPWIEKVQTEIVKDGVVLAQMYAYQDITGKFDQGFNSVITLCNKGEHVWVRITQSYGRSLHGEKYSSFSGYLLWESE